MNEPNYVVYGIVHKYYPTLHLVIIRWLDKAIYEKTTSSHPLKKLTRNRIEKLVDPLKFYPVEKFPWSNGNDEEVYLSATLKNIREIIEKFVGRKLSYMYFIY